MDFRDIIKKMNDTCSEKKVITESVEQTTEKKLPSLKNIFEALQTQTPIPVVGKEGDKASTQAGFIHIDDTSPAGKAMSQALSNLAKDKKAQIVVPTAQQKPTTGGTATGTGLSTGGGGTAMKEAELDEKWAGDAKVKPTGQYKDKTKEELKSMLAKLKKSGPHHKDSSQAKKMRQINFALRAKGGWKSGEGAAMKEESLDEKAKNPYAIGMAAAKKAAGITKKHATDLPKSVVVKGHEIAKKIKKKEKTDEGDIASTKSQDTMGAGLGAGRKDNVLEYTVPKNKYYVVQVSIDSDEGRSIDVYDLMYNDKTVQRYRKLDSAQRQLRRLRAAGKPVEIDEQSITEASKPDFLDLDKDGNKKESMKKASQDAKKKKVKESMNPKIKAAYHEGYSHGLRGATHSGKRYEDMEEARQYHEGYKCGLDECYGMSGEPKMGDRQAPVVGLVGENMPASVPAMATQAMPTMEDDMEEGNAFTAALAKTPQGGKFSVGGKTFTDRSGYDAKIDEFAFESLDKQLSALLEDAEPVSEGLSVSMSTGQQGSPDSVSVTGTDDEAGKLLSFIKQVGLGGMGGEATPAEPAVVAVSDYGAPKGDNADMKALLQKVGAGEEDYKDEEGHDHDHSAHAKEGDMCSECGMMEAECACDKEAVEEVQTQDQTLYDTTSESEVKEDDGEGYEGDEADAAKIDSSMPAKGGATNEDGAEAPGSDVVGQEEEEESEEVNESEELTEWANNAGGKGTDTAFEQDIEFMTKVISGGLNKPKVTGQTTIPVIAGQDARDGTQEDLASWMKLAGVKKSK